MRKNILIVLYVAAIGGLISCVQEPQVQVNPFDQYRQAENLFANDSIDLPEGSFARLHRDVFKPTCANSGCHDGHFEPDFRNIESSYNTLVYHPIIKNDVLGTYEYRVLPYELEASVLWNRMNQDIDGQSGIMPLVVDPDNDWNEKREEYLNQVRLWIEAGAPDVFGNIASKEGLNPYVQGLVGALTNQSSTYLRDGGNGGLLIPRNLHLLQMWFSIQDEDHIPSEISAKLYLSKEVDDQKEINGIPLKTIDERIEPGFDGEEVLFSHRGDFRVDTFAVGESVFIHLNVLDPDTGELIRIPGIDSPDYIKELFSFKLY